MVGAMDRAALIEWIDDALAKSKRSGNTKTKAGVAAALGRTPAQGTRLLSGTRRLQVDEIMKIANYLEVPPPVVGLSEEGAAFEEKPQNLAPIYGVATNNAGDWVLNRHDEPIDSKPRAPHFINSTKVFGIYVPDDAMAPRFKLGEIAWIDPVRPARPGDDVIVIATTKTRGPERFLLAELRAKKSKVFVVAQHKDQNEREFSADRWSALLVLPRY